MKHDMSFDEVVKMVKDACDNHLIISQLSSDGFRVTLECATQIYVAQINRPILFLPEDGRKGVVK